MRLIDADLLLSQIGNRYDEEKNIVPDNLAEGFMQMEKLIKEQPIAYDVDKVVEKLKSEKKVISCVDNEFQRGAKNGYNCALNMAIEIIKRGGTDER